MEKTRERKPYENLIGLMVGERDEGISVARTISDVFHPLLWAFTIPGFTINRANEELGIPEHRREGAFSSACIEIAKVAFWANPIYQNISSYIS